MWPWQTSKGEPITFSRTRLITRPMSVDRTSIRLTSNSAPQITLRLSNSRPLKCTRTHPCNGVHGAVGAWVGARWEWEYGAGGLDKQDCLNFMSHHLIQSFLHTRKTETTARVNQNE